MMARDIACQWNSATRVAEISMKQPSAMASATQAAIRVAPTESVPR